MFISFFYACLYTPYVFPLGQIFCFTLLRVLYFLFISKAYFAAYLSFWTPELNFLIFPMSERRQAESARIRDKYPDRIPVRFLYRLFGCLHFLETLLLRCSHCVQVIVEKAERSDIPDIDKKKLVILSYSTYTIVFNYSFAVSRVWLLFLFCLKLVYVFCKDFLGAFYICCVSNNVIVVVGGESRKIGSRATTQNWYFVFMSKVNILIMSTSCTWNMYK